MILNYKIYQLLESVYNTEQDSKEYTIQKFQISPQMKTADQFRGENNDLFKYVYKQQLEKITKRVENKEYPILYNIIMSDVALDNIQNIDITPEEVLDFLSQLPIEKFFGVGKVTAEKMKLHGIFNGSDLRHKSRNYLEQYFGKSGSHFFDIVRGIQHSEVKPDRIRKSIAAERTFSKDISTEKSALELLEKISEELERRTKKSGVKGKTVTLKIKYSDFTVQTRSKTINDFVSTRTEVFPIIEGLMQQEALKMPVRLLGISLSKLNTQEEEDDSVSVQLEMAF
jgi:DNA polymerase-4